MKEQLKEKNFDKKYLQKIKDIEFKPIFILGIERSGTSLLYKILSETKSFNPVIAYHIIQYDKLLYNHEKNLENEAKKTLNSLLRNYQKTRIIDQLKINADFPEEYRFILEKKTGQITLNTNNLNTFIELCKKIQYISNKNKPLLLKNPSDFTNFLYIKSIFPESKIIFIHRHPIYTLNSQIRANKKLMKNQSQYLSMLSPSYKKIYENKILLFPYRLICVYLPIGIFIINRYCKTIDIYLAKIKLLDKNDFLSISYENLCKKPNIEIEKILNFLGIVPEVNLDYKSYIKPRNIKILRQLEFYKKIVIKKMNRYIEYINSL